MKRLFVPTETARDWKRLLAKPDLHWKQGRSAMTLALSWESAGDHLPREVERLFSTSEGPQLADLRMVLGIPEYEVRLPGGKRPSQTDLMVIATNPVGLCVIAVEGKVDEPFGPSVAERRGGASSGQEARIDFLLQALKLDRSSADHLRYQLLHRAASSLLTAKLLHAETAVTLVHAFGECKENYQDYEAFCAALGQKAAVGKAVRIANFEKPALYLAWCVGESRFLKMKA
jgi:hypothetical protein